MSSLLHKLRDQTAGIHHAIHNHPLMSACQEERLSLDEYTHILKAFYVVWERLLPHVNLIPIPELRTCLKKRGKALQRDLIDLGIPVIDLKVNEIISLKQDELIGISYVLIGSSMGAVQLKQSILNALGDVPHSYFSISPQAAGWPLLTGYLNATNSLDNHEVVCSSAQKAFETIQIELSKFTSK